MNTNKIRAILFMNTNKIRAILYKEWLELRHQGTLMMSLLVMPILFTVMPIAIMTIMAQSSDKQISSMSNIESFSSVLNVDPSFEGLSLKELGQALLAKQFSVLFLIIPLFIPVSIAAYSIVGEKTRHTLEPLLATPIRTWELLLAKVLTALIPTLIITYACAGIFAFAMRRSAISTRVFEAIITPGWVLMMLLCAPIMALIANMFTVIISSRASDPRTAQQTAGVIVVPLIMLFAGQFFGLFVVNPPFVVVTALVLSVIAAFVMWFAVRLFQRESILMQWSS
jgi:ABC-2 type transport system permease protein